MSLVDLVQNHALQRESVSIGWALELLLKYHGEIPVETQPLQVLSADRLGFDERAAALLARSRIQVIAMPRLYVEQFTEECHRGADRGCPVVFQFPRAAAFDFEGDAVGFRWQLHCFCATRERGVLEFLSRLPENPELITLTERELRSYLRLAGRLEEYSRIHCLLHARAPGFR